MSDNREWRGEQADSRQFIGMLVADLDLAISRPTRQHDLRASDIGNIITMHFS